MTCGGFWRASDSSFSTATELVPPGGLVGVILEIGLADRDVIGIRSIEQLNSTPALLKKLGFAEPNVSLPVALAPENMER
jgi:hypothetical protein